MRREWVRLGLVVLVVVCAGLVLVPAAFAANTVYWSNAGNSTISYANLDGSGGGGQLATTGATASEPKGVAIDPAANRIYWANYGNSTISYANLDGSGGGGQLNTTGATLDYPQGVAIDPAANRIYWANSGNSTISYANLDGSGGGGQLATTGATASDPFGVAIDPAANRIYWSNAGNSTISYANLDGSGGGGQLATTGATPSGPAGVAIDPAANRIYWANYGNSTIAYANLDGSGGGGQLPTTGATPENPDFPALLEVPSAAGAPVVSGGSTPGSTLSCSEGSWAPDLLGSFLYRAPRSFAFAWSENGTPITGATSSSITAGSAGSYSCRVTATNHAGSAGQSSAAFTVSQPPQPPQPPQPSLPSRPRVTSVRFDDQQITLSTPSVCTANPSKLVVKLTSTKVPKSRAAKLNFSKGAFYIGDGVKHKRHKTVRTRSGKTKRVVVTTYTANATKDHVPVTLELLLTGLKPGTHPLKVMVSYKHTTRQHDHNKTVTVTKTLNVKFAVC